MEFQPEEYIPETLRLEGPIFSKPRQVMYGIGFHATGTESFGMWKGPVPSEKEMMEVVGDNTSVIIRFNADGSDEVIWKWKDDRWVSTVRR